DLTHQKQVGEQCPEMAGGVQIVNQLGADGRLGQNQLNGGKRIASVAIEHCKEPQVLVRWLKAFLFDCRGTSLRQPRQGLHSAMQELTDLSTRLAALLTGQPLRSIGQQKLVALFHSVATIPDLSQHRLALDLPSGWMSRPKKMSRQPIAGDHALSDKSRGPSSRRSSIS